MLSTNAVVFYENIKHVVSPACCSTKRCRSTDSPSYFAGSCGKYLSVCQSVVFVITWGKSGRCRGKTKHSPVTSGYRI